MPYQNRVNPYGDILAVADRGSCMGNRGILHEEHGKLTAYHKHKHWIICRLSFRGRRRALMQPGKYTELFFLDEATALAAGHRPCAECNRARYNEFMRLWKLAQPEEAGHIDNVLHRERFRPYQTDWRQKKRIYTAPLYELPPGTFITFDPTLEARPYLVLEDSLLPWSFAGYDAPVPRPDEQLVTVLTPPSTVRTLMQGYRPQVYPEAYV